MAKHLFILIVTVYWAIMGLQSWATTDVLEGKYSLFRFHLVVIFGTIIPVDF